MRWRTLIPLFALGGSIGLVYSCTSRDMGPETSEADRPISFEQVKAMSVLLQDYHRALNEWQDTLYSGVCRLDSLQAARHDGEMVYCPPSDSIPVTGGGPPEPPPCLLPPCPDSITGESPATPDP